MSNTLINLPFTNQSDLQTLVEHRRTSDFERAQLNVFETHQQAYNVGLTFDDLTITGMVKGKKVMHLPDKVSFDYLPGETVITAPGETMNIDFPEADRQTPTQCIALVLSKDLIIDTVHHLNQQAPLKGIEGDWKVNGDFYHLSNSRPFSESVNQLLNICFYDQTLIKDQIVNLRLREIVYRLMQTQARNMVESKYTELGNSPFAEVIKYIKNNLSEDIKIETLSAKAHMSRANFYRHFTQELGISPGTYIKNERLKKAKGLLKTTKLNIQEIAFDLGFKSASYFTTFFKNESGMTPQAFRRLDV